MINTLLHGTNIPQFHSSDTNDIGVATWNFQQWGRARLIDEAMGTVTLTLTGVKNGSEVTVIDSNRNSIANVPSSSGNVVLTLSYYDSSSTKNSIRVFINNLGYEVVDFNYTLSKTPTTVTVAQRVDRNYKNPV